MSQPNQPRENRSLDPKALGPAREILERGIAQRAFPGAVLAVGCQRGLALLPAGHLSYSTAALHGPVGSPSSARSEKSQGAPVAQVQEVARVTEDTVYDLASLTKPIATTTAAMMLCERGLLDLDAPVSQHLPEFTESEAAEDDPLWRERGAVVIRHLLAHTSGLPAYERFYLRARQKEHVIAEAAALPLQTPPGRRTRYSDVGFILLGEIIERVAREPLDVFCAREIFQPLGMRSTCFNPPAALLPRIAPTEQDDAFRHRLLCGEVHDENAWVMGGVAGHAGLFGSARDLALFCGMMLEGGRYAAGRLVSSATIAEFTRAWAPAESSRVSSPPARPDESLPDAGEPPRALGWDKPSPPSSSGRYFSPSSYGHLGFTGTSIWIDPEKSLFVVLLTNRVHPTRDNERIREIRPALHDAVVQALAGERSKDGKIVAPW